MTLVSPSQSSPGEEINASDINGPVNQITSVVNGNLDDTNISSLSGTKLIAGTLPIAAFDTNTNIETRFEEAFNNFIADGCVWAATTGLNGTMTAGVLYTAGTRVEVAAVASKTFTASRDTYVSVTNNGTVEYSEVTNGAAAPSLPANSLWVAKVVTSASAITRVSPLFNSSNERVVTVRQGKLVTYYGWGAVLGNGTGSTNETVTFPSAYSKVLFVQAGLLAASTTGASAPTAITDLQTAYGSGTGWSASADDVTNSNFAVTIAKYTGTTETNRYFGYTWIAIGVA